MSIDLFAISAKARSMRTSEHPVRQDTRTSEEVVQDIIDNFPSPESFRKAQELANEVIHGTNRPN